MTDSFNFGKPLSEFTEEELHRGINKWSPQYGALAQYELQRRLQEKNIQTISELARVTKSNSKIAAVNSASDNWLAKVAIGIAVVGLIVQTFLSLHRDERCSSMVSSDKPGVTQYYDCYVIYDLGPIHLPLSKPSYEKEI